MEQEQPHRRFDDLRLFGGPQTTFRQIIEHLPEFEALATELADAISYFGSGAYSNNPSGALRLVTAQGINDFVDGTWDCLAGRGRPALRAARSVFESLINLKDLLNDPELEERYLDHLVVVEAATRDIKTNPGFLTTRERIRRRIRRRRENQARLERVAAIEAKYDRRFLNQWHPTDFRTRAEKHGFVDDYQFYRKSSAVLHGASAGKTGLVADSGGHTHFRTGPALELCQIAYPYILRFFQQFVDACGEVLSHPSIDELSDVLTRWRDLTPDYVRLVSRIDKEAWPKHAIPGPCAVAVIRADTGLRWYLHDMPNGRIKAARLTGHLPQHLAQVLEVMTKQVSVLNPAEPVSVAFIDVEVEPLKGAKWTKDEDILLSGSY